MSRLDELLVSDSCKDLLIIYDQTIHKAFLAGDNGVGRGLMPGFLHSSFAAAFPFKSILSRLDELLASDSCKNLLIINDQTIHKAFPTSTVED